MYLGIVLYAVRDDRADRQLALVDVGHCRETFQENLSLDRGRNVNKTCRKYLDRGLNSNAEIHRQAIR